LQETRPAGTAGDGQVAAEAGGGYAYDVFLSYRHDPADRDWVRGVLVPALDTAGVRVCVDDRDFQLGASVVLEMERAVAQSRYTLAILSPAYLTSTFTEIENALALHVGLERREPRLLLVLRQPVQLPPRLSMLVSLDATDPARWEAVVARICTELQRPLPGPAERPACPYPGMVPFGLGQALFFGRERETEQILHLLRLHPFLAVIGPSGSGKSSLVFAGLVPALARSSLFGPGGWRTHTLRPGGAPLTELRAFLAEAPARNGETAERTLLILDQFEAAFARPREEWEPYHRELLALRGRPGWYVVLTVRADFYDDLMGSPLWPEVKEHRVEVVPLAGEGLRDAIVKPAATVGCYVEDTLIERLLHDAAREPGSLPFVQETLVLLWDRLQWRFLPLAAYEALGEGERNGLQVAIARRADAVIAALPEAQQALARRIFLRLVQFGEGRADTRRRLRWEGLRSAGDDPRELDELVDHLASRRLLTLGGEAAEEGTVDLAHEALLGGWPTLQHWVAERRGAEQVRRRLEEAAGAWCERVEKGQGGGLLDEVEVAEAERWRDRPDAQELGYSDDLKALIVASRAAVEKNTADRQEASDRELRQAQQLAREQQQRAEDQARAVRRLRRYAAGLVMALVAATLIAGMAFWQSRVSHSRQLAAQAMNLLGRELDQAAVLSAQAYRLNINPDTRSSLAATAQQSPRLEAFLHGNPAFAWSVAYSSDGQVIASGNTDGTITLWSAKSRQLLCPPIAASAGVVYSVSFAPKSRLLASGGSDGTLRLWDADRCAMVTSRPAAHQKDIEVVTFSPDGRILASAADDLEIHLWDGRSLTPLLPSFPRAHTENIKGLAFNRDGTLLASGSTDGRVRLWRMAGGKEEGPAMNAEYKVWSVRWSPVDDVLAAGTAGKKAILWDAVSHRQLGFALGEFQDTPGHTGDIFAIAFSPDGRKLATASTDSTIRLWDLSKATRSPEVLNAHIGQINSLAFSPDGRWLVSAGWDGHVILWNMTRRSRLAQPIATQTSSLVGLAVSHDGKVWAAVDTSGHLVIDRQGRREQLTLGQHSAETFYHSVRFSPDGQRIAAGGEDGAIRFWDAHTLKPIGEPLHGHDGIVNEIAFRRDGVLASAGSDGIVALWDTARRQRPDLLQGHLDDVNAVAFSPDLRLLASASDDHSVLVWNVAQRRRLARLLHDEPVHTVAFSPDGHYLVTGGDDERIRLWDTASLKKPLAVSDQQGASVMSLRFSPRRPNLLASLNDKHQIQLWSLPNLKQPVKALPPQTEMGLGLAFSPDGSLLASGGEKAFLMDLSGAAPPVPIPAPAGRVLSVDFGPEGSLVADGPKDRVLFWNRPGKGTGPVVLSGSGGVRSMAMTSDGNILALGDSRGILTLWDLQKHRALAGPVATGQGDLSGLAFSPDDRLVATAGEKGTIRVWRRPEQAADGAGSRSPGPTLHPIGRTLDPQTGQVRGIQFSPDGRTLAAAGNDGRITLWDLRSWKMLRYLKGHGATVHCLAFRPGDSDLLASGGRDRQVLLWDLKHGRPPVQLPGHSDEIKALAFSPDGGLLATASDSEVIMLWNAGTGERIGYWMATPGKVTAMAFLSPEVLLSAGSDGVVSRWDLRPESWLALARHMGNWVGAAAEEGHPGSEVSSPSDSSRAQARGSVAAESAPRKP